MAAACSELIMNALRNALCSLLLLIATVPLMAQGTYTQIDVPGAIYGTQVSAINTAGDIIGFYVDGSATHGFLLSGGVYSTIDYPGATYTYLNGINDLGQIVGYGSGSEITGFQYDVQTQSFTTITCPKVFETLPYAINNNGVIAGTVRQSARIYGFEITGSRCTHIVPPGIVYEVVLSALTAKGGVVGNFTNAYLNEQYFTWNGTYKLLNIPSSISLQINGVNPAGTAIVGYHAPPTGGSQGFLFQNGILSHLQFPGSAYTKAFGINSSGVVVGFFVDASNATHGFTWTPPADAPKP